jgi:hypothetical protein
MSWWLRSGFPLSLHWTLPWSTGMRRQAYFVHGKSHIIFTDDGGITMLFWKENRLVHVDWSKVLFSWRYYCHTNMSSICGTDSFISALPAIWWWIIWILKTHGCLVSNSSSWHLFPRSSSPRFAKSLNHHHHYHIETDENCTVNLVVHLLPCSIL